MPPQRRNATAAVGARLLRSHAIMPSQHCLRQGCFWRTQGPGLCLLVGLPKVFMCGRSCVLRCRLDFQPFGLIAIFVQPGVRLGWAAVVRHAPLRGTCQRDQPSAAQVATVLFLAAVKLGVRHG